MMDDLAYIIAVKAFRSSRELGDIYEIISHHDNDGEFTEIKESVASLMGKIDDLVISKAHLTNDEQESEIRRRMNKYGVYL